MPPNPRLKAYRHGHAAEQIAALYFRLRGYRIVKMRYKTSAGEIDLIARRGKTLVMVEVKTRKNTATAIEAVTPRNRQRVASAANHFLAANPAYAGFDVRFDAVVMGWPFYWRHLDNAWQGRT